MNKIAKLIKDTEKEIEKKKKLINSIPKRGRATGIRNFPINLNQYKFLEAKLSAIHQTCQLVREEIDEWQKDELLDITGTDKEAVIKLKSKIPEERR